MSARRLVLPPATTLVLAAAAALATPAYAGLFDDEEARKAILDLRARVTANEDATRRALAEQQSSSQQLTQQVTSLQRSLLDLNNQLELLRQEIARLRGNGEQTQRDVADLQRAQKDALQAFDERLRKLEPQKVAHEGKEFAVSQAERQAYDDALATMRRGEFDAAAAALAQFQARWPASGFTPSARFWAGNALYGKRDYKGAIAAFRGFVNEYPDHPKAPEALLALANSQAETKDTRAARRTLDELLKQYPQSEAASAGKERLAALR